MIDVFTRGRRVTIRVGDKFGRNTIHTIFSKRHVMVRCACGSPIRKVNVYNLLANGPNQSCGCWNKERARKLLLTQNPNLKKTRLDDGSATFRSWQAMMKRCGLTIHGKPAARTTLWKYYADQGVKVCKRWRVYSQFLIDMGPRPKGRTLDRYPNCHGNYKPGNCRWATAAQQVANRRKKK